MGFSGVISTTSPKSSAYDVSARGFFIAQSDAGVTLTDTQKNATNQLVIDLKAAGLWNKMKAVYPMVGGTATSHKFNLITPADTNAAFRLNFVGGWTHSSNGALPNGTNAYADTFLNSFTQINNTGHLSYYSRTQTISTTQTDIGNLNNIIFTAVSCFIASTATIDVGYHGSTAIFTQQNISDKRGFVISSKLSSTSLKLYKNGNLQNTVTTSNTINTPSLNIYIGARNNNGTADTYSTKQLAFASIGDGLTDAEALSLYNAVQTFQTTLNRQVI